MSRHCNFGGLPDRFSSQDAAAITLVPVPYDGTSTWIKGADKGPLAILTASENLEFYDIETDSEVYRKGIFTDAPVMENGSPELLVSAVEERVASHLAARKFVVALGGEHTVSIGSVRAHKKIFPDLSVLQFDAHSDLRDEYLGSPYNHACVMARIKELCPITQVGIRSMDVSERGKLDLDRVFFARAAYPPDWSDQIVSRLGGDVYVTIDLDVFDPSLMPSTGTPEPGGLLWYTVIEVMRKVIRERNLVGFDVVELCPGPYKAPDFLAAKLIYQILSLKFAEK